MAIWSSVALGHLLAPSFAEAGATIDCGDAEVLMVTAIGRPSARNLCGDLGRRLVRRRTCRRPRPIRADQPGPVRSTAGSARPLGQ
jgi:hypothetical protein